MLAEAAETHYSSRVWVYLMVYLGNTYNITSNIILLYIIRDSRRVTRLVPLTIDLPVHRDGREDQ